MTMSEMTPSAIQIFRHETQPHHPSLSAVSQLAARTAAASLVAATVADCGEARMSSMRKNKSRDRRDSRRWQVNNNFWDRTPEERAVAMDVACQRGGTDNFSDLSPEERSRAYEDETL